MFEFNFTFQLIRENTGDVMFGEQVNKSNLMCPWYYVFS